MLQSISVKHNIEMAHRLFQTPGKCEQIHGHSWWVTLTVWGEVNDHGLVSGIDFGILKQIFRGYLDRTYDHRVLLNQGDPFAGNINLQDTEGWSKLPGLQIIEGDPTTENIAREIGVTMAYDKLGARVKRVRVEVWETSVNNAAWQNFE